MALRLNSRREEGSANGDRAAPSSDRVVPCSAVWPIRPSVRPEPSPVAYAIHDAKNMLGVLSANLEVLHRALRSMPLPRSAADALGDIDESAERLNGLLREALSGLQGHRRQPMTTSSLSVPPVVAAAVDRMLPAARARGIRIAYAGSEDACATIEPELLERVIVNLVENAVRFSRPGDTVEVEYAARNGRMTLAVGDRGPGVPEEALDEIFASYRRRDADGTESHFGLGLAFCREVARARGGDAWVFNRAGGGACFVFEIA
jgi:signal transduction histidine kinase